MYCTYRSNRTGIWSNEYDVRMKQMLGELTDYSIECVGNMQNQHQKLERQEQLQHILREKNPCDAASAHFCYSYYCRNFLP